MKVPKIYSYMNERIIETIRKGKWHKINLNLCRQEKEINVKLLKGIIGALYHIRKEKLDEILKELEDCDLITIYYDGQEKKARFKKWQPKKEES